ncbi:MAG TPA: GNAT family N-acetyltransferase [Methylomirabilota bacterium]|nr:GNAT family N-acetyltransferase [Methylomirabilota bacterium]
MGNQILESSREVERTVALRNGALVVLRPIRPDDAPRLVAFHARLSAETIYRRFFSRMKALPPDLARHFANVDFRRRIAIVAEPYGNAVPTVIGVARCEPTEEPATAEVGLVVEDAWQGLGLGPILLRTLLHAAERCGVLDFRADVLASNGRMIRLLTRSVDITRRTTQRGVTEIRFRARRSAALEPSAPLDVARPAAVP